MAKTKHNSDFPIVCEACGLPRWRGEKAVYGTVCIHHTTASCQEVRQLAGQVAGAMAAAFPVSQDSPQEAVDASVQALREALQMPVGSGMGETTILLSPSSHPHLLFMALDRATQARDSLSEHCNISRDNNQVLQTRVRRLTEALEDREAQIMTVRGLRETVDNQKVELEALKYKLDNYKELLNQAQGRVGEQSRRYLVIWDAWHEHQAGYQLWRGLAIVGLMLAAIFLGLLKGLAPMFGLISISALFVGMLVMHDRAIPTPYDVDGLVDRPPAEEPAETICPIPAILPRLPQVVTEGEEPAPRLAPE